MEVFIPANFSHHFIFGGTKESWGGRGISVYFVGPVVFLFVFSFLNLDNSETSQIDGGFGTFLTC